jgi:hypothetical protein
LLISVIPATEENLDLGIMSRLPPYKKLDTLSEKYLKQKGMGHGSVCIVTASKCKALISKPSMTTTIKKK